MLTLFRQQATIEHSVTVSGFGYWSGLDVRVQFRPSPPGTGIVFFRQDQPGSPAIPALVASRENVPLRTSLENNGQRVAMIEHIMSALAGLQIDNCQVWVDNEEMPGLDGSCLEFVRALHLAGRQEQDTVRNQIIVRSQIRVENENGWIEATPAEPAVSRLKYSLDFSNEPAIGRQEFEFVLGLDDFVKEVAPARTFITHAVAEQIKSQGLGSRVSYTDLLVFGKMGPIQNQIRFPNECARHKLLDLIGDLSLSGHQIIANIHSFRGGHALNAKFVEQLLKVGEIQQPSRQIA